MPELFAWRVLVSLPRTTNFSSFHIHKALILVIRPFQVMSGIIQFIFEVEKFGSSMNCSISMSVTLVLVTKS